MVTLEKEIDKFKTKYLSPYAIFAMDIVISLTSSIIVCIIGYLAGADYIRNHDLFIYLWGATSVVSSAMMFYVVGTHTIIIRHFSFKDTGKFMAVALFKVIIMAAVLVIMLMTPGMAISVYLIPVWLIVLGIGYLFKEKTAKAVKAH